MAAVTNCSDFEAQENKVCHCFHCFPIYLPWSDFSSSHVWMWELNHKEGWAPKNQCLQTVVLAKTLKSPLDCKEIKPVNTKWNQPWTFVERTVAEAEAPILWPPYVNSQLIGKDPDAGRDWEQEEKRTTEDEIGWMASPTQWTWVSVNFRVGDGQGGLVCCDSWGLKESDNTEWLNWTELNN